MNNTIRNAVAKFSDLALQYVRRTLEAEMIASCALGEIGTQAHIGKLEMLSAIGAELDARKALIPVPPHFDTCMVDGMRLSFQIRVF